MHIRHMAESLIVDAPAKLNLFLEVLGRRDDGFHELETLMVSVGLYDTLKFAEDPSEEIRLRCFDAGALHCTEAGRPVEIPTGTGNLVDRAARLLREETGCRKGVRIDLFKRIPAAAGLGGGSSDAAATLAALNQLWDTRLTRVELMQLAGRLGSDIPFFLAPTGIAVCRGRGEIIDPVSIPISPYFVIACPKSGLGTADVYREYTKTQCKRTVTPLIDSLRRGDFSKAARSLHNALQPAAERLNEDVRKLEKQLAAQPVLGHLMSGSGSSCFAWCANTRQAVMVAARLRATFAGRVFVAPCRT